MDLAKKKKTKAYVFSVHQLYIEVGCKQTHGPFVTKGGLKHIAMVLKTRARSLYKFRRY
jgi:hypothetical protein